MATDMEKLTRDILAAMNLHETERVLQLCADDFVMDEVPVGHVYRGKNELAAFLKGYFTDFPDAKWELETAFY
jgi:ketosteroid isomerase-like protein